MSEKDRVSGERVKGKGGSEGVKGADDNCIGERAENQRHSPPTPRPARLSAQLRPARTPPRPRGARPWRHSPAGHVPTAAQPSES